MKVIIAGSRQFAGVDTVPLTVIEVAVKRSGFKVSEVITGGAAGVDEMANLWAKTLGIDRVIFPANWKRSGRSAGPLRNMRMAKYADALIAIWDGKSRGTRSMINIAEELGLESFVFLYPTKVGGDLIL